MICNEPCGSKGDWFVFKISGVTSNNIPKTFYIHVLCHIRLILALAGYEDTLGDLGEWESESNTLN